MKKVLAILVLAMFVGGITAPVFASDNTELITISKVDKEPKKTKKADKKSSDCSSTKTSDCSDKKSNDAAVKVSDCDTKTSDCDTKAKKDCSKTCGG